MTRNSDHITIYETKAEEAYRQLHATIYQNLNPLLRSGLAISRVAKDTGLCTSTIRRIWYDETRRPQIRTILILALYLEIEVKFTKQRVKLRSVK